MSNIETMRKLVSVTEYLEVINSQLFVSQNYEKKKKVTNLHDLNTELREKKSQNYLKAYKVSVAKNERD